MNTIEKIRQENLKTDIPEMGIGDTVEVGFRIKEGGKERVQNFTGVDHFQARHWHCPDHHPPPRPRRSGR